MKGTIDINITRKDGTTEHRQEHNVIFDIPAIALRKSLEYPEIPRVFQGGVGYYDSAYDPSAAFNYFGLSEDTMDLTAPAFRPIALRCISGTATAWYNSAITRTVEDKRITVQATWTVQSALTLKSIGFLSYNPGYNILNFVADNGNYNHLFDGHIYPRLYYVPEAPSSSGNDYNAYGMRIYDLNPSNFKFTNRFLGGLKGRENPTKSYVIPYELANPNERAAFTSETFEKSSYQYPYYYSSSQYYKRLCIYNKNDVNTPLRYFDLSQFEGAITSSLSSFFIVNTGTKNYLMQIVNANSTNYRNIWQIPDAAVEASASIPLLSSQSLNDALTDVTGSISSMFVFGNYVLFPLSSGWRWVQIADDLSVKTYSGFAANQTYPNEALTSSRYFRYVSKSESGVHLCTFRSSNMYLPNTSVYYTNSTAANFSTPISLAEGDVLTVSYKIEVA